MPELEGFSPPEKPLAQCPRCDTEFDQNLIRPGQPVRCPYCEKTFRMHAFNPVERTTVVDPVEGAGPDGATPCGFHPGNLATSNCQHCGTFICELCKVLIEGRRLCVGCFDRLRNENKLETTVYEFRDYGAMAASSAVFGCVIPYFAIILGPLAVYYAIAGFRQKKQMNETDGRLALTLSLLLGLVGTGVFLFLIGSIVWGFTHA